MLLVLVVGQLLFIFSNSHKNAAESTEQSSFFVRLYIECIEGKSCDEVSNEHIDTVTHYVRKTAHFTEYAVLGILTALYARIRTSRYVRAAVLSAAFGLATASLDEFSQSFSEGRANQLSDVLLDTAGGLFGTVSVLCLSAVVLSILQKRRHNT